MLFMTNLRIFFSPDYISKKGLRMFLIPSLLLQKITIPKPGQNWVSTPIWPSPSLSLRYDLNGLIMPCRTIKFPPLQIWYRLRLCRYLPYLHIYQCPFAAYSPVRHSIIGGATNSEKGIIRRQTRVSRVLAVCRFLLFPPSHPPGFGPVVLTSWAWSGRNVTFNGAWVARWYARYSGDRVRVIPTRGEWIFRGFLLYYLIRSSADLSMSSFFFGFCFQGKIQGNDSNDLYNSQRSLLSDILHSWWVISWNAILSSRGHVIP